MDKTILYSDSLIHAVMDVVVAFDALRDQASSDEWDTYCDNPDLDDLFTKLIALQDKINSK